MIDGELIANRYKVQEKLGEGGMGTVYLVADILRNLQPRALKIVKRASISPTSIESFKKEFDIMKKLRHPNVIEVYDFGFVQLEGPQNSLVDHAFITMEYLPGESLQNRLTREPSLTEQQKLRIMMDICRSLDFIHSRGIIHRDIKPGNIMLSESEQDTFNIKIMDFGLADFESATKVHLKGTLPFLPPEILPSRFNITREISRIQSDETTTDYEMRSNSIEMDQRIDIYSLGITFYRIVTGNKFFEDDTPEQIVDTLKNEFLFEKTRESLLRGLERNNIAPIIKKMTAYDPQDRYQRVAEILLAINRAFNLEQELETIQTRNAYFIGSQFIGRDRELDKLCRISEKTSEPNKICLIKGPIGIGKSRLIEEFKKECQLKQIEFFEGSCHENVSSLFEPFVEIIETILLHLEKNKIEQYGPQLKKLLPYHERFRQILEHPVQDPRTERFLRIQAILGLIGDFTAGRRAPVVLIIHDLQWADEGTLEVLENLLAPQNTSTGQSTVKLCASCRDDGGEIEIMEWLERLEEINNLDILELGPFNTDDIEKYFQRTFGFACLDETLLQAIPQIGNLVGGNPFFLREMIQSLVEKGIITRRTPYWAMSKPLSSIAIPRNVFDITAQRILKIQLDIIEKSVLHLLVLINVPVSIARLDFLLREHPYLINQKIELPPLVSVLNRFENLELVMSDKNEEELLYSISHGVIRSVLKTTVFNEAGLHLHIARKLEKIYVKAEKSGGIERADLLDGLSYHYLQSTNPVKAIHYLEKAGDWASNQYASVKAQDYYDKVLSIANADVQISLWVKILLKKGTLFSVMGNWAMGSSTLQKAIELSQKVDDRLLLGHSYWAMGDLYYLRNDYEKAHQNFLTALSLYKAENNSVGIARSIQRIGFIHWRRSNFDEALQCAQRSLELFSSIKNIRGIAYSTKLTADVMAHTYRYTESLSFYRKFLQLARQLEDKKAIGEAMNNMGVVHIFQGNYDEALDCYLKYKSIVEESGNKQSTSIAYGNIADVYYFRNQDNPTKDYLEKAISIGRELAIHYHLCSYLIDMARLLIRQKKFDEARLFNDEGLAMAQKVTRREYIFYGKMQKAQIDFALAINENDKHEAVADLDTLLEKAINPEEKARIHYQLWKMTASRNHRQKSFELYSKLFELTPREEFRRILAEFLADIIH